MTIESAAQAKAAEASWVESIRLEAKAAIATTEAFQVTAISDDLLPRTKESK